MEAGTPSAHTLLHVTARELLLEVGDVAPLGAQLGVPALHVREVRPFEGGGVRAGEEGKSSVGKGKRLHENGGAESYRQCFDMNHLPQVTSDQLSLSPFLAAIGLQQRHQCQARR